jgi:hypothetical protein
MQTSDDEYEPRWLESAGTVILVLLLALVLLGGLQPLVTHRDQQLAIGANCTELSGDEERLSCYDNKFRHAAAHPARGELAPLAR